MKSEAHLATAPLQDAPALSEPPVSVVIPVFNGMPLVLEAIESVLRQTYSQFELIVVDDCSRDDTVQAATAISDPRLRVVRNEKNRGAIGNWNHAVSLARGRYVKLLCADDFLYPEALERQVRSLEEHPSAIFCSGPRDVVNLKGKVLLRRRGWSKPPGRIPGRAAIRRSARAGTNLFGEPGAVLFRREAFEVAGGFPADYSFLPDWGLWMRFLLRGDVVILPESVCVFRVSRQSASTRMVGIQSKQTSAFLRQLGRDPAYGLQAGDVRCGCWAGKWQARLRAVFYKLFSR